MRTLRSITSCCRYYSEKTEQKERLMKVWASTKAALGYEPIIWANNFESWFPHVAKNGADIPGDQELMVADDSVTPPFKPFDGGSLESWTYGSANHGSVVIPQSAARRTSGAHTFWEWTHARLFFSLPSIVCLCVVYSFPLFFVFFFFFIFIFFFALPLFFLSLVLPFCPESYSRKLFSCCNYNHRLCPCLPVYADTVFAAKNVLHHEPFAGRARVVGQ